VKATIVPRNSPLLPPFHSGRDARVSLIPNPIHGHGFLFLFYFISGLSEIGFGDNMPIRGDHEPDARMPRVGVRAVHFAEGGGSDPTFTPRGARHAREREREITETLILIFGRSFRIMDRTGRRWDDGQRETERERERGDDVEGDNLFLTGPLLIIGSSRVVSRPRSELSNGRGRQDGEFDQERDNERIGIKFHHPSFIGCPG